jgi:hypothetical protein
MEWFFFEIECMMFVYLILYRKKKDKIYFLDTKFSKRLFNEWINTLFEESNMDQNQIKDC